MDLSSLFPPSDLLEKVRGVESGLRQRRKLSGAGAILSLLTSTFYLLLAVEKDIPSVRELVLRTFSDPWLLLLAVGFFLALLVTWSRFWLRTSRQPFRYTCSIGSIEAVDGEQARPDVKPWMSWLPHDMTRLLNERVQRFFFADQPGEGSAAKGEERNDSAEPYIHIRAHWVVRKRSGAPGTPDVDEIEIMPRVRLGPPNSPEVMAQSTVFTLEDKAERAAYEELLEQVYHCVVTEVYQQLKGDVRTKIDLLPTARHRAIALLHEANDYARSNTLHAYEEAAQLYREAAALCDPRWRTPVRTPGPRMLHAVRCGVYRMRTWLRRAVAHVRPAVDELDLIAARAITGYARMVVFTRVLRTLGGQNANISFDARPVARDAVGRIASLSRDMGGHADALFDAQVTLALAEWNLGDNGAAAAALRGAQERMPQKAEQDGAFILASGLIAPDRRTRLGLFRRAVEREPRSEVAQFCLAAEAEALWRERPSLERSVADLVVGEYERVLKLNPGNLAACASAGYIRWLLEQPDDARRFFEQGLRFKVTSKRDLFVSKLDYGLARIEAECGNFIAAYRYYLAAVSVLSVLSVRQYDDYRSQFFWLGTRAFERRFRAYYRNVRKAIRGIDRNDPEQYRIGQSVHAFVESDLGDAFLHGAGLESRLFDEAGERRGKAALRSAIRRNPAFLLPYGTLAQVLPLNEALELLRRGLAIEPTWPAGKMMLAHYQTFEIPDIPLLESDLAEKRYERRALTMQSLDYAGRGRLAELEESISKLETELEEAPRTAADLRARTLALVRELLPHEWLWKAGALNLDALNDRALDREYRWERELTPLHISALYAWARCFLTDSRRAVDAIRVLDHLRKRFWPTLGAITADLVTAKLGLARGKDEQDRAIVEKALRLSPAAVVELAEQDADQLRLQQDGVAAAALLCNGNALLTRQQLCDADEQACRWNVDYRTSRPILERRARACQQVAERWSGTDDAEALYGRATELSVYGWPHDALARELEKRAATATEEEATALLERAVLAAEAAVRREPKNREYHDRLAAVRWTRKFGSAAKTLAAPPDRLAIHISPDLVPAVDALLEATKDVRRSIFGVRHPAVQLSDPLRGPRTYRILIGGTVVVDEQSPESVSVVDRIMPQLALALRARIPDVLYVDDVLTILNLEKTGEGSRLRRDGLLPEFTSVVRALAAERIPLPPLMPVIRAFRQAYDPGRTLVDVVEQVRSHPAVRKRIEALQAATKIAEGAVDRLTVVSERQVAPAVLRRVTRTADCAEPPQEGTP